MPAMSLPPEITKLPFEWLISDDASDILGTVPAQVVPRLVEAHAVSVQDLIHYEQR